MTDEELEAATGEPHVNGWPLYSGLPPPAEAYYTRAAVDAAIAAAVAAERERLARLCESSGIYDDDDPPGYFAQLIRMSNVL